jgi:hypothetical protein
LATSPETELSEKPYISSRKMNAIIGRHSSQEVVALQIGEGECCELFGVPLHVPKADGRCI